MPGFPRLEFSKLPWVQMRTMRGHGYCSGPSWDFRAKNFTIKHLLYARHCLELFPNINSFHPITSL